VGGVTAHGRGPLAAAMPDLVGDRPGLALRSPDSRALWRPAAALRELVVVVGVLAVRGTGAGRTAGPVSYHAKTVKGLLVRHLVSGRTRHRDPLAALGAAADALDLRVADTSSGTSRSVDLVGRYP
jgi:hypothetical protein